MDERTLKALVRAGAVRHVDIIANGARFHVEASTHTGSITAATGKGKVKTWATLDAAAKWVRGLGMGGARINLTHWQPAQREMPNLTSQPRGNAAQRDLLV